jgi:hypothetical protein
MYEKMKINTVLMNRHYYIRTNPETVKYFKYTSNILVYTIAKGHGDAHPTPMIVVYNESFDEIPVIYTQAHFRQFCKAQNIKISDLPKEFADKISTLTSRPSHHSMWHPSLRQITIIKKHNKWSIKKK